MGQSQSNQQNAENSERFQKISALMNSADPNDQALLSKMMRDVDKIIKQIDFERSEARNAYMTGKEIANKNYERKIASLANREKKYKNMVEEKKRRNSILQNRIARTAAQEGREATIVPSSNVK